MSRARRSMDWGFPRWRGYSGSREAAQVRLCDRAGCTEAGECPAPHRRTIRTSDSASERRVLVLRGSCNFGSVEIKSY